MEMNLFSSEKKMIKIVMKVSKFREKKEPKARIEFPQVFTGKLSINFVVDSVDKIKLFVFLKI